MSGTNSGKKSLLTRITLLVVSIYWYVTLACAAFLLLGLAGTLIFSAFEHGKMLSIAPVQLMVDVQFPGADWAENIRGKVEELVEAAKAGEEVKQNPILEKPVLENIQGSALMMMPGETQFWFFLGFVPLLIVNIPIVLILRRLLRSARDGSPFTFENIRRIRIIGILLLSFMPLQVLVQWIIYVKFIGFLEVPGAEVSFQPWLTSDTFLLGLLVLVLAQVFDMGVRLQQDSDLTV